MRQHRELCFVAQSEREQRAVGRVGQDDGCLATRFLCTAAVPRDPVEPRGPSQTRTEGARVPLLASQTDHLRLHIGRLGTTAERVHLDRVLLHEFDPLGRVVPLGVLQRGAIVSRGLPVRTAHRGVTRGPRRPLDDRVHVAGGDGVRDDAAGVGIQLAQHREHPGVELDATRDREGVDDRTTRQLVAELHTVGPHREQSALLRRVETRPLRRRRAARAPPTRQQTG